MSKFFRKQLRRVSWLNSETPQYPLPAAPEVPNENGFNGFHPADAGSRAFQVELPEEEGSSSEPITLAIIGAGQRGKVCRRLSCLRGCA